ncbi:integrator complex subunit 12 [Drosophila hydei]|uniref:Integrator complex subunit 12 n=1 Tax=Drosophila hydei TaxID=7224 RepID=A0A6J1MJC3_DROHY|nr:integrator complex subunit 12 [Drosophila hydei]
MKRGKDEDKDDVAVNNNNNNSTNKINNASPNVNIGSNSTDANSSSNNNTPCTVRTTGRVKKPKLVYDPSDNYISRGSRNSLPAAASSQSQPAQSTSVSANALQQQQTLSQQLASSQSLTSQSNTANQQAALASDLASQSAANSSGKDDSKETVAVPSAEQQRNFDTCMKCGKSEAKRGSGYKSNFLTCKSCTLKWHFLCLPITFEILTNARKKFKCEKCRRCLICMTSKNGDKLKELVMCCACANVYHLDCHWPPIMRDKLSDPKWKCYSCCPNYNPYNTEDDGAAPGASSKIDPKSPPRKSKAGRKKRATSDPAAAIVKKTASNHVLNKNGIIENSNNNNNNNNANKPSTIVSKTCDSATVIPAFSKQESEKVKGSCELAPSSNCPPNTSIPILTLPISKEDKENGENKKIVPALTTGNEESEVLPVQTWNVEQVVGYVEKFYPREASVFKSQEIDGAALMVLTRQDVIDRFGLKLGPALRIYELVLGLQTSVDDVTLAWCE